MTTNNEQLEQFIDYCRDFYDIGRKGSIYPFATEAEIRNACLAHVTDPKPSIPFDGDTMDREMVRERILAGRAVLGVGETDFEKAILDRRAMFATIPLDLV